MHYFDEARHSKLFSLNAILQQAHLYQQLYLWKFVLLPFEPFFRGPLPVTIYSLHFFSISFFLWKAGHSADMAVGFHGAMLAVEDFVLRNAAEEEWQVGDVFWSELQDDLAPIDRRKRAAFGKQWWLIHKHRD